MGMRDKIAEIFGYGIHRNVPRGRNGRVRIGLVTIIPEEFNAVRDLFGLKEPIIGTNYYVTSSRAESWDVALVQTSDRSNLPAQGDVRSMMEDLRPQILILVGIAGGLCEATGHGRDGLVVGDVVLADFVSYTEFLKIEHGTQKLRQYPIDHPSVFLRTRVGQPISNDFDLRSALSRRFADHPNTRSRIHIGQIVAGEKVLGDPRSIVQEELLKPFDKALALDMESIGMARAVCHGRTSFWYHPRYAIIRGISDLVNGEDNSVQRETWKSYAAYAAAEVAKQFVDKLPPDPQGSA
jgi:nucleoside phosphorylase